MTYREYFSEHPAESPNWCEPYVSDGGHAICVNDISQNEISGLMIAGKDVDWRDDTGEIKRLAKAVNEHYDDYRGWSDTHIATEAMRKTGCAECPYFSACDQMEEEMR